MGIVSTEEFQPRTADKVERLLDILEEVEQHPDLRGKLAMHGGTAINLFMLGMPRLSVDIDVSYVGAVDRETMLLERPLVETAIGEVATALGYAVSSGEGGHAGRTFILRYGGAWGSDHVKIDCIYMNRSPIVTPTLRSCPLRPDARVLMFCDAELAAGKVKAFFDRVKVRDLYDISNLGRYADGLGAVEEGFFHKTVLFYASLSARFPLPFEGRSERFRGRRTELEDQLLPMLRLRDKKPTLEGLMEDAEEFVRRHVLPRDDAEREYLERLAGADYRPGLLFADAETAGAASSSPEALWKVRNLREMARG